MRSWYQRWHYLLCVQVFVPPYRLGKVFTLSHPTVVQVLLPRFEFVLAGLGMVGPNGLQPAHGH